MRIILALVLVALGAWAQFDSATVLGSIRDASGLAVKGARVRLTNVQTGVEFTASTDDAGSYQFLTLKPGRYKVAAESTGFKTAVSAEFEATVNARQRVDLQLQVGNVAESVTVADAVAQLETDTSSRGTVVGSQQIVNLPLNGRAYADLALLAPGVRRSGIAVSRDASFNANGMRSSQNNFVIDGVDNNAYGTSNQGFSNQVVQITPDAVQEFRLETSNFSAEFGRAGGAVINATIRSGTNELHGSAWEFLRNTSLNAVGFIKPVQNQKPVLIQNQYGVALGGPIKKSKMFLFGDYEGFRRVTRSIQFATLPTLAMRRGELGIPVVDPYSGAIYSNGIIPPSEIRRYAREILADLPLPNAVGTGALGTGNNFQSQPRRTDATDKGDVRYDHYLSDKITFFGRYSHRLMNNLEPPAIPGPSGGDSNGDVRVKNWQVATGATWTINPTSLLEFRMGISLTEGGKAPLFRGTPTIGERFGIPNIPNDPRFTGGVMSMGITGFTSLGVQGSNPQFQNPMVYNPKANYTKVLGRHSLKTGYEYQAISTDIDDFNPKYGSSGFGGRFSQLAGSPSDDRQFIADFLLGARSGYQLNNPAIVTYKQRMHFLYLQDDFKVNRKLTLNLGVRYEYATPQWESQNRLANFDPANNTVIEAKNGGIFERALVRPDRNNWAPRLGAAYTLNDRTVIRAAYGISYIHFNRMGGENLLAYNLPFILNPNINQIAPARPNGGQPLCASLDVNPTTCFLPFERGFPNNFLSINNVRRVAVRTNQIPFQLPSASVQSWHFTIQRRLAEGLVLDLGYVGTRGRDLLILGDLNQSNPNAPNGNLSVDARRPIPGFGFIQSAFPGGFLDYHAFQAKLERRFSGGLYILNSFTWSKAIDNASGHLEAQNGDNSRVNIRNLASEKGLSGYDQPFNNTTTLLWDLPVGKGRRFASGLPTAANLILGGWRMTAINFWTSGTTVNLSYNPTAAQSVSGAPTYRPNISGDPVTPEANRTERTWLNPANVSIVPSTVLDPFGNAGRNIVRGPSLFQLNLGLHKDFYITERHKLEFRMEAFNATNKTNLGNPNGNRSAGAFGTITGLNSPAREIQFALRYAF